MIQAQDYPDIITVQDMANYIAMDALEPLDAYYDKGPNPVVRNSFIQSALEYSIFNGKIYSMPILAIAYGMIVNEQLLNSVGVKIEDLKTWDDIKRASALLTKGDTYGYAIAAGNGRFVFRDGLIAGASDGLSPDQTEKEKQYKELLQFYKDMAPYMPRAQVTWAYPEMFTAYCDGRVGMIANGSYFSANVYSINPEIIKVSRVIPFPRGPSSNKGGALISNSAFSLVKGSKNKEAAWNVLKVIYEKELSAKNAASINITPRTDIPADMVGQYARQIYPTVIEGHTRLLADFGKTADAAGVPMPKILGQAQMETVFQKQLLDLIAGTVTVNQAYTNIAGEFKNIKAQF
jgi:ABC-type glycerol-3-phosphate transport system substrate-binding protein